MNQMLKYSEALSTLLSFTASIKPADEILPLHECSGRTLSENVYSDIDFPSFDNSAVDGFAVMFEGGRTEWNVSGKITAGNFNISSISAGNAIKIMTGAKLPDSADSVIPVEDVLINDDKIILIDGAKFFKGINVRKQAEYLKAGALAINAGTVLTPANLTLAASCGYAQLKVRKPLKLAILTTGDELVNYSAMPVNDQVRSTNSLSLALLAKKAGMHPVEFGLANDALEDIKLKLAEISETDCDIIITSGGVSVGEHDFVQEVLRSHGAEIIFWKANIKPGKPFLFSVLTKNGRQIPVFSFPGNPVSVFVNFVVFLVPFINKLYNRKNEDFFAVLDEPLKKKDNKLHFVLGDYAYNEADKTYSVRTAGNQSSGNLATLGLANCLILFDEELRELQKGAVVKCIKI